MNARTIPRPALVVIARHWALWPALLAGAVVRVAFLVSYRPAFLGHPDSRTYITGAAENVFEDAARPARYPLFLRVVREVSADLSVTIAVQHLLGLAAAVLLYALVYRVCRSTLLAAIPAAVVALNGDGIFLEHAVLSDAVFVFLLSVALLAALEAVAPPEGAGDRWRHASPAWASACGLALGLAATQRTVGMFVIPVVLLTMLLRRRAWRPRIVPPAVAALGAVAILGSYAAVQASTTDHGAQLTRTGGWSLYARAASFARCTEFEPPRGTEPLCEGTPASTRQGANFYHWNPQSPAWRLYGEPPAGNDELGAFARRAILHQPGDYLTEVARDFARYVAPREFYRQGGGLTPEDAARSLLSSPDEEAAAPLVSAYYDTEGYLRARVESLTGYQRIVRVHGALMVVLLALSITAVILGRGRMRLAAVLCAGTGLVLLVVPVATLFYHGRYAVPAVGPLSSSAALGLAAAIQTVGRHRDARARRHAPSGVRGTEESP